MHVVADVVSSVITLVVTIAAVFSVVTFYVVVSFCEIFYLLLVQLLLYNLSHLGYIFIVELQRIWYCSVKRS